MMSAISEGHTDLADLFFLLAFIVAVLGIVVTVVAKPLHVQWACALIGGALGALAFFVL